MKGELKRPYKVLVVDDEMDVPEIFRQHLRRDVRRGLYELYFAESGVDALEKLEGEPEIDLVITDINMPEMDGLTLLENISQDGRGRRCVVLSAYGDLQNIREAMHRGAFDFVVKPVDFGDMRSTIERSLENLEVWREATASRDELVMLNRDIEVAWRIQNSVLPRTFPTYAEYDLHGFLEPAKKVSGDFYDVIRLDGGRLGLVVADVSGKGVPAAMLMMSARTMVRGLAIGLNDPGAVLAEANGLLCEDNDLFTFVTMFFGIFDPDDGSVTYALAGHDAPALFGLERSAVLAGGDNGVALGLSPGEQYPVSRLALAPGQAMCVYTDGITEAQRSDGGMFGQDGLLELLGGLCGSNCDAGWATRQVVDGVRAYVGGYAQSDDITCLVLARRAQ